MTLFALLLAANVNAAERDRSDAERADTEDRSDRAEAREDRGRSDAAHASSGRSSARERAHHDRSRQAHGYRPGPRRGHHAHGHHVRAHYVPPAHRRVVVVHGAPPPPRERVVAKVRRPAAPEHDVAVTVNVLDLPAPLFSASAEVALGRHVGLVGTGGLGVADTGVLYDVGGDVRAYFLGDFDRGVFVGGGLGVTNHTPFAMGDTATTIDGFVGAKYTASFGLTADVAVGLEGAAHEHIGGLYPTVKLGVGWAF